MKIRCPACKAPLEVPDRMAGKNGKCPKCANVLKVPTRAAPPVAIAEMIEEEPEALASAPLPVQAPPSSVPRQAMARTESVSIQVHPDDEQSKIDLMQKFHWNLHSSQEIKVKDSHLESALFDDTIYSVTETEHYVKLVFTRDVAMPNVNEIKALERQYFGLKLIPIPKLFPYGSPLNPFTALKLLPKCFTMSFKERFYGPYGLLLPLYYFKTYKPAKAAAEQQNAQILEKRQEVLEQVGQYA